MRAVTVYPCGQLRIGMHALLHYCEWHLHVQQGQGNCTAWIRRKGHCYCTWVSGN